MNITITQDNSRVEQLGSSGASIIEKLYLLAIDFNNTLTLEGNINSTNAYGYLVDYLNTNYGPDFIVNTTNRYIHFEDDNVFSILIANNIGDGTGITEAQASQVDLNLLLRANTNITSFNEFKYFTAANKTDYGHNLMFMNCTNLSSIDLSEWEIALLRLFDGSGIITVNAPKLKTFGSSFSGTSVFLNCKLLTTVQSLGIINKIVDSMFNLCTNLTTVNLPQTCTLIERQGFCAPLNVGGGKLTTIDLSNITSIGECAFRELRMLTKTLPDDIPNVTSIGNYAFQNCTNISGDVNYPNLTYLGQGAFSNTSISTVTDLGTVSTLSGTFSGCTNLTSVTLPQTLTNIGGFTFDQCANLVLNLSAQSLLNVTSMGSGAFNYCRNLTGIVNLPNLVGSLGGYNTFRETGISKILSLGQCSNIGEFAFQNCTNLTEAVLPTSNLTLRGECFEGCTQLSSINVDGVVSLQRLAFNDDSSLELLYFKELLDYDHSDGKTTTNNGLFVGPTAYIYAPKLQNVPGGFDAGGRSVAGLFITGGYLGNGPSKNIIYFKDLSSVLTGAFCGGTVKHLIINNTTPPLVTAFTNQKQNLLIDVSGAGVSRSVVQNVWVPDSAVNTYKADTYWGEFGNKIQGLSGMSKVTTKALWDLLSASAKEDTLIEEYM